MLSGNYLEEKVKGIVLSDNNALKDRKIEEFTYGKRPDGSIIGRYQDTEYAIFKQTINPKANGNVDLMVMRSFVGKMQVVPRSKRGFLFYSSDEKQDRLIGKYGIDILSINQEYFNQRQASLYSIVLVQQIKRNFQIK